MHHVYRVAIEHFPRGESSSRPTYPSYLASFPDNPYVSTVSSGGGLIWILTTLADTRRSFI